MISTNPIRADVSDFCQVSRYFLSDIACPTRVNTDRLLYPQPLKLKTLFPPSRFEGPSNLLAWRPLMTDPKDSCSDFVNCDARLLAPNNSQLLSPSLLDAKDLPLEWILDPTKGRSRIDRILAQLTLAEAKEPCPWFRDDIRIAWITTRLASQGNKQAHVDATYAVLGLHPDKVWPAILARREAILGTAAVAQLVERRTCNAEATGSNPVGGSSPVPSPSSPKKPVESVGRIEKEDAA
jgi:hypothetical protein